MSQENREGRDPLPYTAEEMAGINGMRSRGLFVNIYEQRLIATVNARDAEIERLRAALERIASGQHLDTCSCALGDYPCDCYLSKAYAALIPDPVNT